MNKYSDRERAIQHLAQAIDYLTRDCLGLAADNARWAWTIVDDLKKAKEAEKEAA